MISVIIPVYNASSTLTRAVASVLNQAVITEVILIEDGSSDDSLNICRELERQNWQIRVIQHDPPGNRGASVCRNLGLQHAHFEWIQFLDADDELLPEKLSSNLKLLEMQRVVDIVIGSYVKKSHFSVSIRPLADPWLGLIESQLGITSANLFKKEKVIEVGGWDERLSSSQEYDLMFRLLAAGAAPVFDDNLNTLVYAHNNSISRSLHRVAANAATRIDLRLRVFKHLRKRGDLTFWRKVAIHGFIAKNLGYLEDKQLFGFRPNRLYVNLYRIWHKLKQ